MSNPSLINIPNAAIFSDWINFSEFPFICQCFLQLLTLFPNCLMRSKLFAITSSMWNAFFNDSPLHQNLKGCLLYLEPRWKHLMKIKLEF